MAQPPDHPLHAASATDTELDLLEGTGAGQLYWAPMIGVPVLRVVRRTDRAGLALLSDALLRICRERASHRAIVDITRVDAFQYSSTRDLKVITETVTSDDVSHWAYIVGPSTPPKLLLESIEFAQRNGALLSARSSFADAHKWLSQIANDPQPSCLAQCVRSNTAQWSYGNYSGCLYALAALDALLWIASGYFNLTELDGHVEAILAEMRRLRAVTLIIDLQHCTEMPAPVHQFMMHDALERLFLPGTPLRTWISVRDLNAIPLGPRETDLITFSQHRGVDARRVGSLTEAIAQARRLSPRAA